MRPSTLPPARTRTHAHTHSHHRVAHAPARTHPHAHSHTAPRAPPPRCTHVVPSPRRHLAGRVHGGGRAPQARHELPLLAPQLERQEAGAHLEYLVYLEYLVFGIWYLVFGIWYLVFGIWYFGTRCHMQLHGSRGSCLWCCGTPVARVRTVCMCLFVGCPSPPPTQPICQATPDAQVEVEFTRLAPRMTLPRTLRLYKLPDVRERGHVIDLWVDRFIC